MKKISFLSVFFVVLSSMAQPSVRVTYQKFETWLKGEPKGVTINEEGVLSAGLKLESVLATNLNSKVIWSAVGDVEGNIFLATGDEGRIVKVTVEGKVKEWAKLKESQVYALALDKKGQLYAASSPEGKVYRILEQNKPEIFFEPKEKYIWSLLWQNEFLYVATGVSGKLYRVTVDGKGELFYDSNEPNLRCLALDKEGKILLGTEGKGLLLKLQEKDRALALYDAPHKEIRQIAMNEKGAIVFSALGTEPVANKARREKAILTAAKEFSSEQEKSDQTKASEATADAVNTFFKDRFTSLSQEKGEVYELEQPGFAKVLWSGEESPQALMRYQGEWLIGTGNEGFLYGVNDRGEKRVIARAESDQITVLIEVKDNLFAVTSNEGDLGRLKPVTEGVYQSDVLDGRNLSRWGALRVKGQIKQVRTRSGNTLEPDKTWYDWSLVKDEKIASPAARYLQYELTFEQGRVRQVDLFYTPKNLSPKINSIVALPSGIGYTAIIDPPQPPQQKTLQQLLNWNWFEMTSFDRTRLVPEMRGGLQTIVWSASDPNSDDLIYELSYRKENETEFIALKKDLETATFTLDTAGWEDGFYYFKVQASDLPSNAEDPLVDEKISEPVLIDNTAPVVEKVSSANGAIIFQARDKGSLIWDVAVSRDGVKFVSIQPQDKVLDSQEETFEVKLGSKEKLFVRVQDEAGNLTSANYTP